MSDFTLPSADEPGDPAQRPRRPDDFELAGRSPASGDGALDGLELEGARTDGEEARTDTPSSPEGHQVTHETAGDPTHAKPPPPSLTGGSTTDLPGGLHDRIARATREGGFGRTLPPTYDDPDASPPGQDWKSACSDDPFTRLFLDRRQVQGISDQMVKQHSVAIQRFWEKKAQLVESGETVRRTVLSTYGDRSQLRAFAQQARDDGEALATPEKRKAAFDLCINTIRTRVLARFEDFVLGDRTLSPAESKRLLAQAEAEGWDRNAAASFLLAELDRRGFRSATGSRPTDENGPTEEALLSSSWTNRSDDPATPERAIGRNLANLMLSGSLEAAQIQALLDDAAEAGVDREAAAAFIAGRLGVFEGEWVPAPGEESVDSDVLAEALASVRWLSPERFAEELRWITAEQRREFEAATARALSGRALTAVAAKELLAGTPLGREEAAGIILGELHWRGFHPRGKQEPTGNSAEARLTSVDWSLLHPEPDLERTAQKRPAHPLWPLVVLAGVVLTAALVTFSLRGGDDDLSTSRPSEVPTVVTEALSVRRAPTGSADLVARLPRGTQVEVTGQTTNAAGFRWYQVRYGGELLWVDGSPENVYVPSGFSPPYVSAPPGAPHSGGEAPPPGPTPQGSPPEPLPAIVENTVTYRPAIPATSPRVQSPLGGFEGTVIVVVDVSASGRVTRAWCQSGVPQAVCAQAEDRARGVRFEPAQADGRAVASHSEVTVVFTAPAATAVPPPERTRCTDSALRALFVELQEVDGQCRRLTDPTEKRACEAHRDEINRRIEECTH